MKKAVLIALAVVLMLVAFSIPILIWRRPTPPAAPPPDVPTVAQTDTPPVVVPATPAPAPAPARAVAEGTITETSLRQGLVLHFTFDREEPAGIVTDASPMGNNGVVKNAHWIPDGKKGGAYEFRADNEMIQVPNHDSLNPSHLTVAAWIKGTQIDGTWRRIIDKSQLASEIVDEGYVLSVAGDWQQNNWRGKATMEIGKIGWVRVSTNVVMDGQWHQIVSTYDGVENILYVDGVRNASTRSSGNLPPTNRPVMIGAESTTPPNPNDGSFRGLIDEPMIWNRALSEAEVRFLFDPTAQQTATMP